MSDKLFAHFDNKDVVHLLAFIGGYIDAAGWYLLQQLLVSLIGKMSFVISALLYALQDKD